MKTLRGLIAVGMCLLLHQGAIAQLQPGEQIWAFNTGGIIQSSPAIGPNGTVYISTDFRELFALRPSNGDRLATFPSGYLTSSPAVGSDGTIYIGSSITNVFFAVNPDGSVKWQVKVGVGIDCSAAVGRDGTVYFVDWAGFLFACAPSDGTVKWKFQIGGGIFATSSPAVGVDGTIYVGSRDFNIYAFRDNGNSATKLWDYRTTGLVHSSPAIGLDGTIYCGSDDGKVYALKKETGATNWTFATGGPISSSPSISFDGTIYVGSDDKNLYAINPNGTEKWRFTTLGEVTSSPTVSVDGTVYFGSRDRYLYAVKDNGGSGSLVWRFLTGDAIHRSSPTIGPDGTVYIGSTDRKFYAIKGTSVLANSPWPKFRHDLRQIGRVNPTGVAWFRNPTDTIQLSGQTELTKFGATFEAVVYFSRCDVAGNLFNEWTDGALEDLQFSAGPDSLKGQSGFVTTPIEARTNLTLDVWHHIAYVVGPDNQRLYLDGNRIAILGTNGGTFNSANGLGFLGASLKSGLTGFTGYIDSFKISHGSKYGAPTFVPPIGDLLLEADTVLLYNFNEPLGASTVTDQSTNNRTGSLGADFAGATTPVLVDGAVPSKPPTIRTQPQNQQAGEGGSVTFSVESIGVFQKYQWLFISTTTNQIAGATNATFTLTNVRTNDAGRYRVLVSNCAGATNSVLAVLTVAPFPILSVADAVPVREAPGALEAVFVMNLSAPAGQAISVQVQTADGTATGGNDYTTLSTNVTFNLGETSKTVRVRLLNDALDEPDESFVVNITNTTANVVLGRRQAAATIQDDEPPVSILISDSAITERHSGQVNFQFTVDLSGASGFTVTVDYSTVNGSATAGSDYLGQTNRLTFPPLETTRSIGIPILGDTTFEPNENFFVNFSNPQNGSLPRSQAVVEITNDDVPPVTLAINDVTVVEGHAGTTNASFTIQLSTATTQEIRVDYATANGSAIAGNDYVATNQTVTFAAGTVSRTISVPVKGDLLIEPNETFLVSLSNPVNATISDNLGVATITDDDLPEIAINDVTVVEQHEGTAKAVFTISLSAASSQDVRVDYTIVGGTASPGIDYLHDSGSLIFQSPATTRTITIQVIGDTLTEPNETLFVNLSNPVNATIRDGQGLGTITDDDLPTVSVNDLVLAEGNAGTVNAVFVVRLSTASSQEVRVDYATANGSATAGALADYLATSGRLTFPVGTTTQNITVSVNGDSLDELDETFFVNLSNPQNATLADNQAQGTITDDDLPPVTLAIDNVTVAEGDSGTVNARFTVSLSGPFSQEVRVNYATTNGTASAGTDYAAGAATLIFPTNTITRTIDVAVIGDTQNEANETFFVNLSGAVNATIADSQGLGTIIDDDLPPVTIAVEDVTVTEGNEGATNAVFVVRLSSASNREIRVDFATANGTATGGSDYTERRGQLVFPPGMVFTNLAVEVNGDPVNEPNETFVLNLSNPSNATLADNQATATIIDDDILPSISITDAAVTEGEGGAADAAANFIITLSVPQPQPISVNFQTANSTATAGNDYVAQSGALTFGPGETIKEISVAVRNDALDEPEESFFVNLTNPVGANLADNQGEGFIADDDAPISLSITDAAVTEGNTGQVNVVFRVDLSSISGQTVTVDYATANGTATAGPDYAATSGRLSFPPGTNVLTITVPVQGETASEPDESFVVNLSNPFNAIIRDNQGIGTITDDDLPNLVINDVPVTEGNLGTIEARFTVLLSSASSEPVTVNFTTADGTASAGTTADYLANFGAVTFPAGSTIQSITVLVNGDSNNEPNETFVVNLINPINAKLADNQGLATIIDDDPAAALSISDAAVTEGEAGSADAVAVFTVRLSAPGTQNVTVDFQTTDSSATAGDDYVSQTGRLTFVPGETTKEIRVLVRNDSLDEPEESFFVNLSNAGNATIADDQGEGFITDDDAPITLSITDAAVTEGNSGQVNAVFTVSLSAASGQNVTVNYNTASGTAAAGSDFLATSGTLTFPSGSLSLVVTVPVLGDTTAEDDESFLVNLTNPVSAILRDGQAIGTITDDDLPALSISDVSVPEGNSGTANAVFTVKLSAPSGQEVKVNYATVNGTATAGNDYAANSGTLTIAAGLTTQSITVSVNGDPLNEPNETFLLNLSEPVNARLSNLQATGTIINDDPIPTLFITDAAEVEGDIGVSGSQAMFTVRLSAISGQNVSVDFATTNNTATAPDDYEAASGTLTIPAGARTQTIAIRLRGDFLVEANEIFFVNMVNPTNATLARVQGKGTIIDDDVLPTLSVTDASITEGNSGSINAVFTVHLSTPSSQTVTADFATVDATAAAGSDYVARSGKLVFLPGDTSSTITIEVKGDTIFEPTETFLVNLSNVVNANPADDQGSGNIIDDDAAPTLSVNDVTVTEGDLGRVSAVFTVSLSSPSSQTITVNYATANGTAEAGSDYQSTSGALTFSPGQTTATITVSIFGDTLIESDETFSVSLSSASNASVADGQGTGSIINNDSATNASPTVAITTPANGAAFVPRSDIVIHAEASDRDGVVRQVDFFVGTTLLGSVTSSPFTYTWTDVSIGTYSLTAKATDDKGATTVSAGITIVVSTISGDVAIVRNFPDPEIAKMQEYLLELGFTSHVFDQEGLSFEVLRNFNLVIWDDLGSASQGLSNADVAIFLRVFSSGIPLYLIGDTLAASTASLSEPQRTQWRDLIHVRSGGVAGGDGAVSLVAMEPHPLLNGRFGNVEGFGYSPPAPPATQAFTAFDNGLVLAQSGGTDVLVAYPSDLLDDGVRTVTQGFRVANGMEAHSLEQRKRLFQNAACWLLRCPSCGLTDLRIAMSGSANPVAVGGNLIYTITIEHSGECEGTGVRITDTLPPGVNFVTADSTRGTWSHADGVVNFNLGHFPNGSSTEVTIVVIPTTPGTLSNVATVRGNEGDPQAFNNTATVQTEVSSGTRPALSIQKLGGDQFQFQLRGVIGRSYRVEASTDLKVWTPLATLLNTSAAMPFSDPATPSQRQRFYRAVELP